MPIEYVQILIAGFEVWLVVILLMSIKFSLRIDSEYIAKGYTKRLKNNIKAFLMFPLIFCGGDPRKSVGWQKAASALGFIFVALPFSGAVYYCM